MPGIPPSGLRLRDAHDPRGDDIATLVRVKCRPAVKRPNLIIDVGMHRGEDTEFYLAKGFDVVAIEANPALVAEAHNRFGVEIRQRRLRIISGAVAATVGPQSLAVAERNSIWTSLDTGMIRRREADGEVYRTVQVPGLRFAEVIAEVGIPHYLKIDIEGYDMLCVEALHQFAERPDFVSIESNVAINNAPWEKVFDELAQLWSLGYRGFKYIDQAANPTRRCPVPAREGTYVDATFNNDCSGLFGDETPGSWLGVDWAMLRARQLSWHHRLARLGGSESSPSVMYQKARRHLRIGKGPTDWYAWYDLHARLKPAERG